MKKLLTIFLLLCSTTLFSQNNYDDGEQYLKDMAQLTILTNKDVFQLFERSVNALSLDFVEELKDFAIETGKTDAFNKALNSMKNLRKQFIKIKPDPSTEEGVKAYDMLHKKAINIALEFIDELLA